MSWLSIDEIFSGHFEDTSGRFEDTSHEAKRPAKTGSGGESWTFGTLHSLPRAIHAKVMQCVHGEDELLCATCITCTENGNIGGGRAETSQVSKPSRTASSHCAGCALFIPDPINPPGGFGTCDVSERLRLPLPCPGCKDFSQGAPLSQVQAQGEAEVLGLLSAHPDGLTLDDLTERLSLSRRQIGRTLTILQGRRQVTVRVINYRSFYQMNRKWERP